MKAPIHQSVPEIIQGDITQQDTESIGNAANSRLAGGGGVDGRFIELEGLKLWLN